MTTPFELSSALFAVTVLGFVGFLWIVWLRRQGQPNPVAPWIAVVAALAPAVLFCSVAGASWKRWNGLLIAIEGVTFRMPPGSADVQIGGATESPSDPLAPEVVIHDLPPGFLTLSRTADGVSVSLPATTTQDGDSEPGYGVVRVDRRRPFANSVLIAGRKSYYPFGFRGPAFPGLTRIDPNPTIVDKFDATKPGFVNTLNADRAKLPARDGPFGLAGFTQLPPETQLYPLRYYLADQGGSDVAMSPDGTALGGFLCRDGWLRRNIYAVLVNDRVRVEHASGAVDEYQPLVATITSREAHHLSLYRVDYVDPRIRSDRRSRAQERRSFRASLHGDELRVIFDTPTFIPLSQTVLDQIRIEAEDERVSLTTSADALNTGDGVMLLDVPWIGGRLRQEFYSRIRLLDPKCEVDVSTHSGRQCHSYGEGFTVGDEAAVVMRMSARTFPWRVLLVVGLAGVALALVWFAMPGTLDELVIVGGVGMLLAIRLLIALQAERLDPFAVAGLRYSLAAFVGVPFCLLLIRRVQWRTIPAQPIVLGSAFIIVAIGVIADSTGETTGPAILTSLAAALALGIVVSFLPWLNGVVEKLAGGAAQYFLLIALALVLFRLIGMGVFGWKERVTVGGVTAALTSLYTPAALIIFAGILDWIASGSRDQGSWKRRAGTVAMFWGFLAAIYFVIPLIVRDFGYTLVFAPPVLLAFAIPVLIRRNVVRVLLAVPFVLWLVVTIALPLVPLAGLSRWVAGWDSRDTEAATGNPGHAEALITKRVQAGDNMARIWDLAAPEQLRAAGTLATENVATQADVLWRYDAQGPLGRGYLDTTVHRSVEQTHTSDHLAPVHLAATFGWVGVLALLLLYGTLAVLPIMSADATAPESSRIVGALALMSIAISALYMFAATTGVMLFTGRNVFLLASNSMSDLLEGVLLAALALIVFVAPPTAPSQATTLAQVTTP